MKESEIKSVSYSCEKCHKTFNDEDRYFWLPRVEWVAQRPEAEVAGFHINAFYSPWSTWKSLIVKYLDAGTNQIKRMLFWNTTLGLAYSLEAFKCPKWEELSEREANYERGTVPSQVSVLVAAVDVQGDRLEVSIVGFYKKQSFVITHEECHGNTANIDDECWEALDDVLKTKWKKEDGTAITVSKCAIDSHYHTNQVAHYAKKRSYIVPVTGIDNWNQDILPSRPLEIKKNGRYFKTAKRRWPLGVSNIKVDLYGRLKLTQNADGSYPSEYIHFPSGLPDEYYKQVTGEVCKVEEDSRGKPKLVWQKQHDAVEALDTMVYSLALYKIIGLNRWSDERWDR